MQEPSQQSHQKSKNSSKVQINVRMYTVQIYVMFNMNTLRYTQHVQQLQQETVSAVYTRQQETILGHI